MNNSNIFSISSEDVSIVRNAYRAQSLPRSSSIFRPSAPTMSASSSSSDIFAITQANSKPECNPRLVRRHVNLRCLPNGSYIRHNNLDVRPLTLTERLNLARIHYVTFPNIIRSCTVVFCLGWFIFVANMTLYEFRQHDSIVHLSFENPKQSSPPSITVCSHNLLDWFVDSDIPKISALKLLNRDDTENILKRPSKVSPNRTLNIDIACWLQPNLMVRDSEKKWINCSDLVPVIVHMSEAKRCFTFFSDIYGQTTRALQEHPELWLKFDSFPSIKIVAGGNFLFGIAPSERPTKAFSSLSVALHDSDVLPAMTHIDFHQLMPSVAFTIPFAIRLEKKLLPPYPTMCFEYAPMEPYVNERKYRSRGECILHCHWAKLNSKCANIYSIYTREMVEQEENLRNVNEVKKMLETPGSLLNMSIDGDASEFFKLCPKTNDSFKEYIQVKEYCNAACPSNCNIETFLEDRMTIENVENAYTVCTTTVIWSSSQVTHIVHRPKWDLAQFLGSLGGEGHIWLGISMLHLSWYVIKMIQSGELFPDTSIGAILQWFAGAYEKE